VKRHNPKDLRFYHDVKRSDGCWCEAYKAPGLPFCFHCWKRLPDDLKADFAGAKIGHGFEEAYDAAVQWLSD